MRIPHAPLSVDLSAPVSGAFFVVEIEHEHGTVLLSDRAGLLGGRSLLPAVLAWDSIEAADADLTCAASALPDWLEWWAGRPARIWEVPPGATGLTDATVVCEGEVDGQPEVRGIEAGLRIVPRRLRLAMVPDSAPIDSTACPDAGETALGRYPAEVYGTVDDCPLLPVALPRHSALSASVEPNATALPVDDATVFPASGTVVVDGVSYTYTSRDDATLMGVQVVRPHRAGTAVSQPGAAVFLAAGHAVEAIGPRRSEGRVVAGGAVDLSAATVTYPALPTVEDLGDLHTYTAEFDAVATGSTARDGIDAIRAATGQVSQSGGTGTLRSDDPYQMIPFPRPSAIGGTDTIILGGYTVAFDVAYAGAARLSVTIGGALVYVQDGGVVVYDASPANFFYHENTDQLPVQFGGLGQGETASITVTSATRSVTLGNDDAAAYATLDSVNNVLSVEQLTDMPDRGRIERVRLAAKFWFSDALEANEEVAVYWRGSRLGSLRQETDGAATIDASVSFDLSQIGSATLQPSNIAVSASGGTTRLNNVPTILQQAYSCGWVQVEDAYSPGGWVPRYETRLVLRPPQALAENVHTMRISHSGDSTGYGGYVYLSSPEGLSKTIRLPPNGPGGTIPTDIYATGVHSVITIWQYHYDGLDGAYRDKPKVQSIEIDWKVRPLSNTDTPASASRSYPNPSVPLSGGYSSVARETVQAPPRDTVNTFGLPERRWTDFTGAVASLALTTERDDLEVRVVRMVLEVEYRPVAHLPVIDLTATVTGRSGNPADVLDDLARRLGTRLEPLSGRRLRRWADAVGWAFARRIDAPEDAETLLHGAAREALCVASERNDGVAYIRRLDESAPCVTIPEDDLLERPSIEWTSSDDVASKLVLRHGAGVVVQSQDRYSRRAARQLGRERTVEMSSAWVSDAATAAHFAADWMRIYGPMRRRIGLSLPYKYADTQVGDVAVYEPLAVPCRVMAVNRDGAGFVSLEIEEIPQP